MSNTPLSEKMIGDLSAIIDDAYPETELTGSWITAENTIGLRGKVTAEEETEIKVSNRNLLKMDETDWTLTEDNTIKNNARNTGVVCTNTIKLKAGQTITFALNLISVPTSSTTFTPHFNDTAGGGWFTSFNNYDLNTLYTVSYTAEEDVEIYFKMFGNTNSDTFEFQFWAELGETVSDYTVHKEQTYTGTEAEIRTYKDITHIYNTSDIEMTATVRTKTE